MKLDGIYEAVKDAINEDNNMEVFEGLTESEKSGLLPKDFLLAYESSGDTRLSEEIRKLQKGLKNIPQDNFLSDICHSMLSKAIKDQMDSTPTV